MTRIRDDAVLRFFFVSRRGLLSPRESVHHGTTTTRDVSREDDADEGKRWKHSSATSTLTRGHSGDARTTRADRFDSIRGEEKFRGRLRWTRALEIPTSDLTHQTDASRTDRVVFQPRDEKILIMPRRPLHFRALRPSIRLPSSPFGSSTRGDTRVKLGFRPKALFFLRRHTERSGFELRDLRRGLSLRAPLSASTSRTRLRALSPRSTVRTPRPRPAFVRALRRAARVALRAPPLGGKKANDRRPTPRASRWGRRPRSRTA